MLPIFFAFVSPSIAHLYVQVSSVVSHFFFSHFNCRLLFSQSATDQQQIIRESFLLISKRTPSMCNFLDAGTYWGKDTKLIYRNYATLYFVFCVDGAESELGILDLIQTFVEALDKCFKSVCELDLVFHVDKVFGVGDVGTKKKKAYARAHSSISFF
jgi:hypothetical protein